jgi:hypothetical protein
MSVLDIEVVAYGALALIGIAALIGRILNSRDMKRGYCEL